MKQPATFNHMSSVFGLQAGGRLLHLLQIVNASDVMVVVSRWYGKTVAQSLCLFKRHAGHLQHERM